ncbi:GIP, partial [Symbiodinium pilosum]
MSEERSSNLQRFSGDDDDAGKALKKWKAWVLARMITVKDLSKEQRGPMVETRPSGLCSRIAFQKEVHDQMGEALGEVFATQDGEAMKEWTARVRETFEKCQRKAKVDFPVEARGWIALHCAGLSEEQKAIVKAKTQGKLDLETVSAGIRSCFPTYRAGGSKSRRATSVFIAEENDNTPEDDETNDFPDVEAFLSDFGQTVNEEDPLSEGDVAEALAVSWKERRAEIGKLQKSRKFGAADQARRSFRIEVEELKRRPRCRRCGKLEKDNRAAETLLAQPENVEEEIYFVGAAEECIPVAINGMRALAGRPRMLGRPTLQKLCMSVEFAKGEAQILDQDSRVPLERNSAGQLLLRLVDFPVSQARTGAASAIAESFAVQQEEDLIDLQPYECLAGSAPSTGSNTAFLRNSFLIRRSPTLLKPCVLPVKARVERHGGLFARVFEKVLHDNQPTDESAWRECVNPRIPSDLTQENPDIIATDASSCDHALRRQAEIRLSARRAMVASQEAIAAVPPALPVSSGVPEEPPSPAEQPAYARRVRQRISWRHHEMLEEVMPKDTMDALRQECPAATEFVLDTKYWQRAEAQRIRDRYPDRFVGSRFVITNKVDEDGEFCGAQYVQDPETFEISYHQKEYASFLRPVNLSKSRASQKDALASSKEVVALRGLNGDVEIHVRSVPLERLCICMHSDAAWGNAKGERAQAGYVLAFAERGGEAQAFSCAAAQAEWMSLLLAEALHGSFDLRSCEPLLRKTPMVGITDCKSLYDHVASLSSLSGVQDKRVCVDIAIIKQSTERADLKIRWAPSELMVCDALTKDKSGPADLLRAILSLGRYQLAPEAEVLRAKKAHRELLQAQK